MLSGALFHLLIHIKLLPDCLFRSYGQTHRVKNSSSATSAAENKKNTRHSINLAFYLNLQWWVTPRVLVIAPQVRIIARVAAIKHEAMTLVGAAVVLRFGTACVVVAVSRHVHQSLNKVPGRELNVEKLETRWESLINKIWPGKDLYLIHCPLNISRWLCYVSNKYVNQK